MPRRDKTAPPDADPRAGHNPGYAEDKPRDREDARQPHPKKPRDPDEGGLHRDPDAQTNEGDDDPSPS